MQMNTQTAEQRTLMVGQAAELLGIHPTRLTRILYQDILPPEIMQHIDKLGNKRRIPAALMTIIHRILTERGLVPAAGGSELNY